MKGMGLSKNLKLHEEYRGLVSRVGGKWSALVVLVSISSCSPSGQQSAAELNTERSRGPVTVLGRAPGGSGAAGSQPGSEAAPTADGDGDGDGVEVAEEESGTPVAEDGSTGAEIDEEEEELIDWVMGGGF
jgi:hypothetical protein